MWSRRCPSVVQLLLSMQLMIITLTNMGRYRHYWSLFFFSCSIFDFYFYFIRHYFILHSFFFFRGFYFSLSIHFFFSQGINLERVWLPPFNKSKRERGNSARGNATHSRLPGLSKLRFNRARAVVTAGVSSLDPSRKTPDTSPFLGPRRVGFLVLFSRTSLVDLRCLAHWTVPISPLPPGVGPRPSNSSCNLIPIWFPRSRQLALFIKPPKPHPTSCSAKTH